MGAWMGCFPQIRPQPVDATSVHTETKKAVAGATVAGAATATDLSLSWSDCGAGKTHAKITGFTPSSLTLGQKTTMTGTGQLDEAVSAANFDLWHVDIIDEDCNLLSSRWTK